MSLFKSVFAAFFSLNASIYVLAVLAVFFIATPARAVSVWQPADFGGTDQHFVGTAASSGVLTLGPTGGFIPDPGLGFDVFIPGPATEFLVQSPPSPLPVDTQPFSIISGGGPMIHFDGDTWFPEEITGLNIDFLNGGEIPIDHETIPVPVILGSPTVPPGVLGILETDLDLLINGWTFSQTGPTVFTDPGAPHSEFFIPGVHVLTFDTEIMLAGGLTTVSLLGNDVDFPIGLSGTMWSEHQDMELATTLMGNLAVVLPFDDFLNFGFIGGTGAAFLTGSVSLLSSYMLTTTVVPEPSSIILFGLGCVGLCLAAGRRGKRSAT